MKKLFSLIMIFFLLISCSTNLNNDLPLLSGENTNVEQVEAISSTSRVLPVGLIAGLGKTIFDAAKSSIKGQIKGFLSNKLKSIFGIGGSDEVSPVDLSENALSQIRKITAEEIKSALEENKMVEAHSIAKEKLRGIQSLYRSYIAEDEGGNDFSNYRYLLEHLDIAATYLETHRAFEASYHEKYWLNISSYALAVSLRYPVLLELHSKGLKTSKSYIANEAKLMYDKLNDMQTKVNSYCNSSVEIAEYSIYDGYKSAYCRLYDAIGNKSYYFHGPYQGGYGPDDPKQKAYKKRSELISQYKEQFGNYSSLLSSLKALTDVNNYTSSDFD